ncbi:MAG: glycerate kinase [gamma proteobacterium symbiont of Lucinoma myriamae]|nr:glycerate kinase [gamma proteobacterium symbiont of Lucinoma myriamae]
MLLINILVAPDSFKGSLSTLDFCRIAAEQIQYLNPSANLHLHPLADGGEGTMDANLINSNGQRITVPTETNIQTIF